MRKETERMLLSTIKYALDVFDNDNHRGDKFFNGENSAIAKMKDMIERSEMVRGYFDNGMGSAFYCEYGEKY